MKSMNVSARTRTFGVCMLMATLLFGPAVAKADAVLDWNLIAVNTMIANGQSPFVQARYAAIVQLAVFQAVNAITGDYQPYLDLGSIVAPHGASADAAAIQAAYHVLSFYFPASASTLLAARANSLALIPDGQAKSDGIATGDAAALAMIALSCQRWLVACTIQDTRAGRSGRISGYAELSNDEWNPGRNIVSMAERNPVRHHECQ